MRTITLAQYKRWYEFLTWALNLNLEIVMPRQYEAIRDSLIQQGKSEKEAKRIAAATYNKKHPNNPVGPHSDKKKGK